MYFRKAVLDHLRIRMIEKTGTPARYMAIAAPERMDLVPISDRQMPSFVLPIVNTPSWHKSAIISAVTLMILILCFTRETGKFLFAPCTTEYSSLWMPKFWRGTEALLMTTTEWQCWPFCHFSVLRKWPKMQSAKWREEMMWSRRVSPSLMKAIFLMHCCFIVVWLCSVSGTFVYSHECITQKWATPASLPLLGKVLWILRKGWVRVRKREELFVVLPLDCLSRMIFVDAVEVVQERCAQCSVWGCRAHFPWRPQPHSWGYIWDCAFSQGSITWSRKLPLMHSHGETSDDFNLVSSGHFFEEKVVSESDASAVIWVMIPRPSVSVKCVCTNCYLMGSNRRSKDNHETIPFSSGTISKCCGSWEGRWE